MNRINPKTRSIAVRAAVLLFVFTVGVALATSGDAWATRRLLPKSANAVDPTNISACGTYSASNTIYVLTGDINTTSTGTCITLSGDDTTLTLQGFNITYTGGGTQTGDGILVSSSANEDVIEGGGGTVSGFAVGILDQGSNTVGDAVEMTENGIGLELNGGSTMIWSNVDAVENTKQGIYINHCSDECGVTDFAASNNGGDGVLITNSQGPRMNVFVAEDNGGAGIHVGCTSGCGTNSEVKVGDAVNDVPSVTGNKGDGIFVDASESTTKDQIYLIAASGNGVTSGYDMHDASSTCGDNHWVTNDWATAKVGSTTYTSGSPPACIPYIAF